MSRRQLLAALAAALPAASGRAAEVVQAPDWPILRPLAGKVVLVDFWASWCAPCRRSFPWMQQLQQRHAARGLVVIAVNLDQDPALAAEFLKDLPVSFRIEYDAGGVVARKFQVRAMPSSFLIDRRGRLRARHAGFRDAQRAARELQILQLLEENA
jgi:thiol-disulfide isomerase/thioredoxin